MFGTGRCRGNWGIHCKLVREHCALVSGNIVKHLSFSSYGMRTIWASANKSTCMGHWHHWFWMFSIKAGRRCYMFWIYWSYWYQPGSSRLNEDCLQSRSKGVVRTKLHELDHVLNILRRGVSRSWIHQATATRHITKLQYPPWEHPLSARRSWFWDLNKLLSVYNENDKNRLQHTDRIQQILQDTKIIQNQYTKTYSKNTKCIKMLKPVSSVSIKGTIKQHIPNPINTEIVV